MKRAKEVVRSYLYQMKLKMRESFFFIPLKKEMYGIEYDLNQLSFDLKRGRGIEGEESAYDESG